MKKLLLYIGVALLLVSTPLLAQPAIQWQKSLGSTALDEIYSLQQTTDGGYVAAGYAGSNNGDFIGDNPYTSSAIIKYDGLGNTQWMSFPTGTPQNAVRQTPDGGYVAVGYSVTKLDAAGVEQWMVPSTAITLKSVCVTTSGNYMIAGGDTGVVGTGFDYYVAKINASGATVWQKTFGGSLNDAATHIVNTSDGGCMVIGYSMSTDGDVTGNHGGTSWGDCWAIKLDSMGTLQWQRALGGSLDDQAYFAGAVQTADKGFVIACSTTSNDGDVSGNHGGTGGDGWVVKLDSSGVLQWQKCLGGTGGEGFRAVALAQDGGFFICGLTTTQNNGDVAGPKGGVDAWLVKLDMAGTLQWQKCLGGTGADRISAIVATSDGGCAVAGASNSINGDLTTNKGGFDNWLVKLYAVPTHVITGNVFEDLNGNCVKDANEVGLYGKAVKATPGNYFATTDANGNYTLFVDTGVYVVSHIASTYYSQICPNPSGTYTATINAATPNSYGNNFADTLTVHCADVKVSIAAPYFRKCFKNTYAVNYSNMGAVAANNVTITINFDAMVIPLSCTIPYTQVGNSYIFNVGTVLNGQGGSFTIYDSVSCAAIIGYYDVCTYATIHTSSTECDTMNNHTHDCHYIVGSCDPNAKEVAISTTGYTRQENCTATDTLAYTIRFQNTGTDTAFTVVVRDTLPAYLDAATVESGASSNLYSFRIYGPSILEWTFNKILLPDSGVNELASHGFVKFTVHQKPNNAQGTVIKNSANIIFDYNNPVLTDTTVVTIPQQTTGVESNYVNNKNVIVYPNPTNNVVIVKSQTELGLITIYNVVGAVVYTQKVNANEQQIDLSKQASGIYFLQTQNSYLKIIKE